MADRTDYPLISVIVPVYNVEPYIKKCIESIQNQTYKNLDIILVDDGSTDNSGKLCDEYAKKDLRIKVVHKENGGLVSARKTGVQIAKGEYVAYVDGDDWIESVMYERLVHEIKQADVIISGTMREYSNCTIYEKNKVPDGYYKGDDLKNKIYDKMIYTGEFYDRGILTHVWNSLYKRELLLKNQMKVPDNIRVGEDLACLYPTLLGAKEIVIVSEYYYHYRMRENSIMGINDKEELARLKILYEYLREQFAQKSDLKENLLYQLDYLIIYYLLLKEIDIFQKEDGIFPYKGIKKGDRIIVYGAGRFGSELVNYIKKKNEQSIVSWIDEGGKRGTIQEIKNIEYDYIVVAVLIWKIVNEIESKLINMGIQKNKIKTIDIDAINYAKDNLNKILS